MAVNRALATAGAAQVPKRRRRRNSIGTERAKPAKKRSIGTAGTCLARRRRAAGADASVRRYSVISRPRLMAMTAAARPTLTHGELARFHRPSRPGTLRLLTP